MSFWLILTLLSVLVASVATILQKVLMKGEKSDPYSYAVVFHILMGLVALTFGLVSGTDFSLFQGNIWMLFLAAALWGTCQVFLFKALQLAEASEVTIVSGVRVIVTILASVIFLNEVFTGWNVFGTVLILISTVLIANRKKGLKFDKGLLYTLAMAFFGGLAIVADSANVQQYEVLAYSAFSNILAGLFILAVYPKTVTQWKTFVNLNFLAKILPVTVFSVLQGMLYLFAFTYGEHTAEIGTIRQASVIVTVLLAVLFLGERDNLWKKCIAAMLVTLGVFFLS